MWHLPNVMWHFQTHNRVQHTPTHTDQGGFPPPHRKHLLPHCPGSASPTLLFFYFPLSPLSSLPLSLSLLPVVFLSQSSSRAYLSRSVLLPLCFTSPVHFFDSILPFLTSFCGFVLVSLTKLLHCLNHFPLYVHNILLNCIFLSYWKNSHKGDFVKSRRGRCYGKEVRFDFCPESRETGGGRWDDSRPHHSH